MFNERENGKTTYMVKHVVSEVNSGVNYDQAFTNIHVGPLVNAAGIHYGHPKINFVNYEQMMLIRKELGYLEIEGATKAPASR